MKLPESLNRARAAAFAAGEQSTYTPGPYRRGYRPGAEIAPYTPPARRVDTDTMRAVERMQPAQREFTGVSPLQQMGNEAFELTGLPSMRRAGRAAASGDAAGAAFEGGMGALGLAGLAALRPSRGLFGSRAAQQPMRNVTPEAPTPPRQPRGERIPTRMSVEIQQPRGQTGSRYRLELDSENSGFITATDGGDTWLVNNSYLDPNLRGQGHGVRMYEDLAERARQAGAQALRSGNSVSPEAQNAWTALQRRGYPVRRTDGPDGPRFEVSLTPPETPTPPQSMPRLPGRASDGSVLPMREPQPFRRTAATSGDLREAAQSAPGRADLAPLRGEGFDTDTVLYHGSPARIDGDIRPTRRSAELEPTGISLTATTKAANQYGQNLYETVVRGRLGSFRDFKARAREVMRSNPRMTPEQASAVVQREFEAAGFAGVRTGANREVSIFDPANVRVIRRPDSPSPLPMDEASRMGGERLNWLGNDRLIRNPTEADLTQLAELGDEMKYVMDTDGNVYAFSAADAHHNNAMRALRDNGVQVRPLGAGADITDPDAAGFIWRNRDGSFAHENANMVESGPYMAFQQRVRPSTQAQRNIPPPGSRGTPSPQPPQGGFFNARTPEMQRRGSRVTEGQAPNYPPNTDAITTFMGPRARTYDAGAERDAQSMAGARIPDEHIFQETGAFRGMDGRWRQEIDDSGARLTGKMKGRLDEVIDHPALFQAYPGLGRLPVRLRERPGSMGGYFFDLPGFRHINLEASTTGELKSGLLHEIQHAVQSREGFAPGGSPTPARLRSRRYEDTRHIPSMDFYERLAGEAEARLTQARAPLSASQRRDLHPMVQPNSWYEQQRYGRHGLDIHPSDAIVPKKTPWRDARDWAYWIGSGLLSAQAFAPESRQ